MKIITSLLIVLIVSTSFSSQNFNRFLPLKIGNRFIYTSYFYDSYFGWLSNDRVTIVINDTTNYDGKKYYVYSMYIVHISGNWSFQPGMFLFTGFPIRVDSLNGNICCLMPGQGCSYSPNDVMKDSLNVKLLDIVNIFCGTYDQYIYRCTDTTNGRYFFYDYGVRRVRKYQSEVGFTYSEFHRGPPTPENNSQTLIGYIINGISWGDTLLLTNSTSESTNIPKNYLLYQNYPNPFNPSTKIKASLSSEVRSQMSEVRLIIYDVLGKIVAEFTPPLGGGSEGLLWEVEWNAENYPSGVYYYRLISGDYSETKKMVLMK